MKSSHFPHDSSCITLSFLFFLSISASSFAQELDILLEFLKAENSKSFSNFIVSSFKLPNKAQTASGLSDLGLSPDLQKLLIFDWTLFRFCSENPELSIDLILWTKCKASLPANSNAVHPYQENYVKYCYY